MVAAWIPGRTTDGIVAAKSDLTLPGVQAQKAWAADLFNGTEQELNISASGAGTTIKNLLIKDYPVFIRVEK